MSYDIELIDPVTGKVIELDATHMMRGGTYAMDGSKEASLNITWNYSTLYHCLFPEVPNTFGGIRSIYGMTGAESIPVLKKVINALGNDVSDDYWEPTEGNAKQALSMLLAFAQMRPDGVWAGD